MTEPVDILAIGAHMADEIAWGMALAAHVRQGKRVALLHLTPGERGHPVLSAAEYAEQKRREAEEAARVFGAPVYAFGYRDGELPVSDEVQLAICDTIRKCRPKCIVTHWKGSIHKDHMNCALNVPHAIFYAALRTLERERPSHWTPKLLFGENWEDQEGFEPEVYLEVTAEDIALWREAMLKYALFRGGVSKFRYMDWYTAMATIRGCENGTEYAVAFAVPPGSHRKRQTLLVE